MTFYDPLNNRWANFELSGEGRETLSRLVPLSPRFRLYSTTASDLVCLISRQLRIYAALLIHMLGYGFQVCRINAARVPAKVVDLEAVGDRTDEVLVVEAMRSDDPTSLLIPHLPVAFPRCRAQPNPAGRFVAAVADLVAGFERFVRTPARVVSAYEAAVLSSVDSFREIRSLRDRRRFAASALAYAGRIRRFGRYDLLASAELMVKNVRTRVSFAVPSLSRCIDAGISPASAGASSNGHTAIFSRLYRTEPYLNRKDGTR